MIGRTLLQQAVPVTFGLVAAGWLTSVDEAREGLAEVSAQRLAVQFGGAAGTLASLGDDGPRVAALLAEELGLARPVLPWHTDRLRIIDLAAALARVTAALGKIARDVTLLAQTEIGELREGGGDPGTRAGSSPRRGGSSAMPHKHNPVAAIAILGCTRQVAGPAGHPGRLRRAGAAARRGGVARRMGAADRAAAADRLGGRWAAELLSGLAVDGPADGGQPGRDQGPAAGRARHVAAGRGARRRPGPRPGGRGGPAGGERGAAAARRAAGRAQARGPARPAGITAEQVESALDPPATSAPPAHSSTAACRPTNAGLAAGDRGPATGRERPWMMPSGPSRGWRCGGRCSGDEHVDRAVAAATAFTEPFQDFITRYAWGEIWQARACRGAERSIVTLTVLAALQHENELAMHVRAALAQRPEPGADPGGAAPGRVYAGVPAANRAFAVAQRVMAEDAEARPADEDVRQANVCPHGDRASGIVR